MQFTNTVLDDCWIVDELVRIKTLEREVSCALEKRTGVMADASLCNRVAELKTRVDLLDSALDAEPIVVDLPRYRLAAITPLSN